MAFSKGQQEATPPTGSDSKKTAFDFLPKYFRTSTNQKFLSATIDQLIDEGEVEKINAFIGRKTAKAYEATDRYIGDINETRQAYQLEPSLVVRDSLDNVSFFKNYNDYINQVKFYNSLDTDHSKINNQEYYVWTPHIDWDKFVNYREYYWLPMGPDPIAVAGTSKSVVSTYTVTLTNEGDNQAYLFTPDGLTRNPTLKLYRGQTYRFEIDCPGQPIALSLSRSFIPSQTLIIASSNGGLITGGLYDFKVYDEIAYDLGPWAYQDNLQSVVTTETGSFNVYDIYTDGVTTSTATVYVERGTIEFTIPEDSPNLLYYVSKNDINTTGLFQIYDITENTAINVEAEILGKKTYTTSSGVDLSNGMKLYFTGQVVPDTYSQGHWYVEGVGTSIKLIPEKNLETPGIFTIDDNVEFDNERFDSQGFDVNNNFPGVKDYFTINRASRDRNPWSRYNRWFHGSVIETAAAANNQPVTLDQTQRARRPIIEFESNIKLWNFGRQAKTNVDLVDRETTDVFSTIEGSRGYYIDGIELSPGTRVLFTADPDIRVNGRIFEVKFYSHLNTRRLSLVEVDDTEPQLDEVVLVLKGNTNKGKMFYYTDTGWVECQQKTSVNQSPLFDVVDYSSISYGNKDTYTSTTFTGTKIFSYAPGPTVDPELGIGIQYQNIGNIGDIVFNFNLHTDSFTYQNQPQIDLSTKKVALDNGYLLRHDGLLSTSKLNGWVKAADTSTQQVIRQYDITDLRNVLPVDVYDNSGTLADLEVRVYLNGVKQLTDSFSIIKQNGIAYVQFSTDLKENDVVILKTKSRTVKNNNGFYEFPLNLERNPENLSMDNFTLGELINHVESIADNFQGFSGRIPGPSNLRDLGNISAHGDRIIQHSSPLYLPAYHLTNKKFNIVSALRKARTDYSKFKRNFLRVADSYGFDGDTRQHLDLIMLELIKDTNKELPYYLSDMVPFGANFIFEQTVIDDSFVEYPMTFDFSLNEVTERAVFVYLNDQHLIHGKEYEFTDFGFVKFLVPLAVGDNVKIVQYEKTDGCCVPPTPTKLGLYPKYEPKIFVDTTYQTPTRVIQGHDGSIMVAFNDYRDDLILELETRIYNNIKISYNTDLFDVTDFISGYFRQSDVELADLNYALRQEFLVWTSLITQDYTQNDFYDPDNEFTYNFKDFTGPDTQTLVPGFWRGVYKFVYDTDRPHTHPWEMLGFSEQPYWWISIYGPAPYTSDNLVMWTDIAEGIIRTPGEYLTRKEKFLRPGLLNHLPVDAHGNLIGPIESRLITNWAKSKTNENFSFGDQSPVETAWRRGSEFPFALLTALTILRPAKIFASCFDRVRQFRDETGQIVYKLADGNLRFNAVNLVFPSTVRDKERKFTSGLVNYMVDYIVGNSINLVDDYIADLKNLKINLASNLAGFAVKEKFRLLLDSRNPLNQTNVFIPFEDYELILNTSSPVDTIIYSGIIIEKRANGFIVNGYNKTIPEFKYYKHVETGSDPVTNVGGISEPFVNWTPSNAYFNGQLVQYDNRYYRVTTNHTSASVFEEKYFVRLAALPITGGRDIIVRKNFEKEVSFLHYGALLLTVQDVVDFLLGYEQCLIAQGFDFNYFNSVLETVTNFLVSVKEFAFWTTQSWAEGAVISLSPAADELSFRRSFSVVDNLYDKFYDYSIFKQDGNALDPAFLSNSLRKDNNFAIKPNNTSDGIYHTTLNLVQKEHVLILKNRTVFNDVIYDQKQGYRQERIKVIGYRTSGWNGSFDAPGFVYDEARLTDWKSWTDYVLGDTVRYKEFYYSARTGIPGTETFEESSWFRLSKKPETKLISNFDFKARQFTDFYDLDTQGFDVSQQEFAQHLIGYQKRQYLENIINDEISQYKFYQGMIREKGTTNSLSKLFDVFGAQDRDGLDFYEEWAIRLGQYGGSAAFEEVEYKLDEKQFLVNPQPIELTDAVSDVVDFVYRIPGNQVYVKPADYTNAFLPTTIDYIDFVKSAGYIREDEIQHVLELKDQLTTLNMANLRVGDYAWVKSDKNTWNVYRFGVLNLVLSSAVIAENKLTITVSEQINDLIRVDDYVGLANFNSTQQPTDNLADVETVDGIYRVEEVSDQSFVVSLSEDTVVDEIELDLSSSLFKFTSHRIKTISEFNNLRLNRKKVGELVWVDEILNSNWGVLRHESQFSHKTVVSDQSNFGRAAAASLDNTVLAVSSDFGYVNVYTRLSAADDLVFSERVVPINLNIFNNNDSFGQDIAITDNSEIMAIGAPAVTVLGLANTGYVALFNKMSGGYSLLSTIYSQQPAAGEKFGHKVEISGNRILVAAEGSSSQPWSISLFSVDTSVFISSYISLSSDATVTDLAFSGDHAVVGLTNNSALIFKIINNTIELVSSISTTEFPQTTTYGQEIKIDENVNNGFAESVAITRDLKYIAIGIPRYSNNYRIIGGVALYKIDNDSVIFDDFIISVPENTTSRFGSRVRFTNDSNILVVQNSAGDQTFITEFDTGTTVFDRSSTDFIETVVGRGNIHLFDRYGEKFIFSDKLEVVDTVGIQYGAKFVTTDRVYVTDTAVQNGRVYDFYSNVKSWTLSRQAESIVDLSKIKSVFLYNTTTSSVIKYLDYIDPFQGKILGLAEQELTFKTPFDPAVYTVSDTDEILVDTVSGWKKQNVGKLWWDINSVNFVNPYQGSITYKANTWNTTIGENVAAVYEWVETEYLPSEWDSLADTEEGLALGISGTSRYSDRVYSVDRKFDNVTKTFKNLYYFWVKNKKTIPNLRTRKITAQTVSTYISNPKDSGEQYIIFLDSNEFALVNCKPLLVNSDIALNIRYWVTDNTEQNIHSHYQLLAEGDITRKLNKKVEKKWFESLVGYDSQGNDVPDQQLPEKLKYGSLSSPRQSMFIDRLEALKQVILRVNNILVERLLVDDYDFSILNSKEPAPTAASNTFDEAIDTYGELRFISTTSVRRAIITPVVQDGRIIEVRIDDPGFGYKNEPRITISGTGFGATFSTTIGVNGEITSVSVNNPGSGYNEFTLLNVRPFTVLVNADETARGKWSLYILGDKKTWFKNRSQNFDTTQFWNYIDWYSAGYSIFTKVDYTVDFSYLLPTLDIKIGETVKINNHKGAGWILLEKFDNTPSLDTTVNYKTIGRENGTIQFNESLYSFATNLIGYDVSPYDEGIYDELPVRELEIILEAIRDSLLINDLEVEYNKLFFVTLRYALSEQKNLDWAFKTSFIRSKHNLGELRQKKVYENDNLASYEDYINEVKPYRTKIREFISDYDVFDQAISAVTDFDLPAKFDFDTGTIKPFDVRVTESGIEFKDFDIEKMPYSDWLNNVGNPITAIDIIDGGAEYSQAPIVEIIGLCRRPAQATAYLSNGQVANIVVTDLGDGYLTVPIINLIGGGVAETGTPAKAVARVVPGLVRAAKVGIKFDRLSPEYQISNITISQTFQGTGSQTLYDLRWPADIKTNASTVIVSNDEALTSDYTIYNEADTTSLYTRNKGVLEFLDPPANGAVIIVIYQKDINLLDAADRIQYYYTPSVGQTGKELGQLMNGVDYGGVVVTGFDFDIGAGWDALPWMSSGWDYVDENYTDYLVISDGATRSFELPYVPAVGEIINIYHIGSRTEYIDDVQATSGIAGSRTIGLSSVAKVVEGQLIEGYGIPAGTLVLGVIGGTAVLTKPLIFDADGTYILSDVRSFNVRLDDDNYLETVVVADQLETAEINLLTLESEIESLEQEVNDLEDSIDAYTAQIDLFTAQRNDLIDQRNIPGIPQEEFDDLTAQINFLFNQIIATTSLKLQTQLELSTTNSSLASAQAEYETVLQDIPSLRLEFDRERATLTNPEAIMNSFVGNGVSVGPILLPLTADLQERDKIIFRKSSSDGSFRPDDNFYDTEITGGDFAYTTAKGLLAEDIVVDGDGFVTPNTSHAPEEVVPGQVFDTVNISVYHKVNDGSPIIKTSVYTADGENKVFDIGQRPNNAESVMVSVNGQLLKYDIDYRVDVRSETVNIYKLLTIGDKIVIISFSQNGEGILDLDYFVGDGETTEFITSVRWLTSFTAFVTVDGTAQGVTTFVTDESYDLVGNVGIRFTTAPSDGATVGYTILSGFFDSISKSAVEHFIIDESTESFILNRRPEILLPLDNNVVVDVSGHILKPASSTYFNVETATDVFTLSIAQYALNTVETTDIRVYLNGRLLLLSQDYSWTSSTNQLRIKNYLLTPGDRVVLVVVSNAEYFIINQGTQSSLVLVDSYANGTPVTVTSFSNHDILDIQRFDNTVKTESILTPGTLDFYNFNNLLLGRIKLNAPAAGPQYVWISKNGTLLTPGSDYILTSNRTEIRIDPSISLTETDILDVIVFSSRTIIDSFGYRIFKDMMNQTVYKRIDDSNTTVLMEQLNYYDTSMVLRDASGLMDPAHLNKRPGVVFVDGERIEYWKKEGNILTRLHRGTMGTGIKNVYTVGTAVRDQGGQQTIPYKDEVVTTKIISNGIDRFIPLNYTPNVQVGTTGTSWYRGVDNNIPMGYGQCNELEIFVSGRRLRKHPTTVWDSDTGPDSPSGDIQLEAEFAVDGINNWIRVTEIPPEGAVIVIQKRIGQRWTASGESLAVATSGAATFIRAAHANLPDKLLNKYSISEINKVINLENGLDTLDDENGNALEWT
jgi:hypothetical protein